MRERLTHHLVKKWQSIIRPRDTTPEQSRPTSHISDEGKNNNTQLDIHKKNTHTKHKNTFDRLCVEQKRTTNIILVYLPRTYIYTFHLTPSRTWWSYYTSIFVLVYTYIGCLCICLWINSSICVWHITLESERIYMLNFCVFFYITKTKSIIKNDGQYVRMMTGC